MRRAFCYRCGPDHQNLISARDGKGWCLVHGSVLTLPRPALTQEEYEREHQREHRFRQSMSQLIATGEREYRKAS